MENFKNLSRLIHTFYIGNSFFDGKEYFLMKNRFADSVDSVEIKKMRNDAITELLNLEPIQAEAQVRRLRLAIDEFKKFLHDCLYDDAILRFTQICESRGYILLRDQPISQEKILKTGNFLIQLKDEIYARSYIIDILEGALGEIFHKKEQWSVLAYCNSYLEPELSKDYMKNAQQIDWSIWAEISPSTLQTNTIKLFQNTDTNIFDSKVVVHNVPDSSTRSFENYLNDAGKVIAYKLIENYKGNEPREIVGMLFALIELNLWNPNLDITKGKCVLATALTKAFSRNYSHQIIGGNIREYSSNPLRKRVIAHHKITIQSFCNS